MMTCSAGLCRGQAKPEGETPALQSLPAATVVGRVTELNGGGYVVEIEGKKFRTVTADQIWQWRELERTSGIDKKDLALANVQIAKQEQDLKLADLQVQNAKKDWQIERGNFARAMSMFEGERKLREQAETFIPSGRVNSFFNNPIVRLVDEFGKPIAQSWLSSKLQRRY